MQVLSVMSMITFNGNLQWHFHRVAMCTLKSESNLNLEMLVFELRGKLEYSEKKPRRAEKRTNNKLNPQMVSSLGIDPKPHWWEASALTSEPSLLSLHLIRCIQV